MILAIIIAMLLLGAMLIWWGFPNRSGAVPPASQAAPENTPRPTAETARDAAEAGILDTLTGYNSAETEAAARLSIDPLAPYLDPGGPFAARRAGQLAERRQRNAPHRTMLVRWAIGEVTVNGASATVITQETWSNQEAGAVAPEQATVRVTYTLRKDTATGRWLIVESSQQPL